MNLPTDQECRYLSQITNTSAEEIKDILTKAGNPNLCSFITSLSHFAHNYFEGLKEKETKESEFEVKYNKFEQKIYSMSTKIKQLEERLIQEKETMEKNNALLESKEENSKALQQRITELENVAKEEKKRSDDCVEKLKEAENIIKKKEENIIEQAEIFEEFKEELELNRKITKDLKTKATELEEKAYLLALETNKNKFKLQTQEQETKHYREKYEIMNEKYKEIEAEKNNVKSESSIEISRLTSLNRNLTIKNENIERLSEKLIVEAKENKDRAERMKKKTTEMEKKIIEQETAFKCEIESKTKLLSLWENNTIQARERIEMLEKTITKKDSELIRANRKYDDLVKETNHKYTFYEEKIDRMKDSELSIVESEHSNGNNYSNNDVNNSGTKSFSQIYTEFVALKSENKIIERENKKLLQFLDSLLIDIEDKVSVIYEKEKLFKNVAKQTTFLSKKVKKLETEVDESLKKNNTVRYENNKLKEINQTLNNTIKDLSSQVKRLICEVEGVEYLEGDVGDPSNPQSIISNELIVFKNVSELQEQNKTLLYTIRDLTSKLDQAQQLADQKSQELKDALFKKLEARNDELKSFLESEKTKSKSLETKCDMYERMLDYNNGGQYLKEANNETSLELKQKDDELAKLKTEYDQYKTETQRNISMYNEEIKSLQRDYYQCKLQLASKESTCEHMNEKYDLLLKNYEQITGELKTYQKHYYNIEKSLSSQELVLQNNMNEISELKQKNDLLISETQSYKTENGILKSNVERLNLEFSEQQKDKLKLSEIISNMNNLHSHYENETSSSKNNLLSKIEELQLLRKKADDELERTKSEFDNKISQKEEHISQLMMSIDNINKRFLDQSKERISAEQKLAEHSKTINDMDIIINNLKTLLEKYESSEIISELVQTRKGLSRMDSVSDTNSKKELMEQIEQFKMIGQTAENSLKELSETYSKYKTKCELETKQLNEKLNVQHKTILELNNAKSEYKQQLKDVIDKHGSEISLLKDELDSAERKYKNDLHSYEQLKLQNASLNNELINLQKHLEESNFKFEKELAYHSEAVKTLSKLKMDHKKLLEKMNDYESSSKLQAKSESIKIVELKTNIAALNSEISRLKEKNSTITEQNSIIYKHLEMVLNKALKLNLFRNESQLLKPRESSSLDNSQTTDENMLLVLKHLRDESHILACQLEVSNKENQRLRLQIQSLEHELQNVATSVEKERAIYSKYESLNINNQELMNKLENLNVLRESNTLLRAEKNKYLNKSIGLEAQNKDLNDQLNPLKDSVNTLKAENEALVEIKKVLEEDNNRWKQRTQQILQKYDRIDPVEHQKLKEEVTSLKSLLENSKKQVKEVEFKLKDTQRSHSEKITKLSEHISLWKKRAETIMSQSRDQLKTIEELKSQILNLTKDSSDSKTLKSDITRLNNTIQEMETKIKKNEDENTNLKQQLQGSNVRFDKLKKHAFEAYNKFIAAQKEIKKYKDQANKESIPISAASSTHNTVKEKATQSSINTYSPVLQEPQPKSQNPVIEEKVKQLPQTEKPDSDIIVIQSPDEREKRKPINNTTDESEKGPKLEEKLLSPQKKSKTNEDVESKDMRSQDEKNLSTHENKKQNNLEKESVGIEKTENNQPPQK